jgi:hypothetical protein
MEELQDYANHFNGLISWLRLGMPVDDYRLQMPHEYLKRKYPEKYTYYISYPDSFEHRRLQLIISYFNQQVNKTKQLLKRLLKIIGEMIYGDSTNFTRGIVW